MAVTFGVKNTLSPTSYLLTQNTTSQQVALSTIIAAPSGGWITALGVWARKVAGAPKLALSLWSRGADGLPETLLARTNPLIVGVAGNVEGPLAWTNPTILGGKATALRVDAGQKVVLGWVISGGEAEVGQNAGADVHRWGRTNATALPANPFGAPQETIDVDPVAMYCTFNDATKPVVTLTAPGVNASTTDDSPTFTASVADIDAAPYGDLLQAYDVQVRIQGTAPLIWNAHFLASPTEQLARSITREYAGPDLVGGVTYEWQIRAQDMAGEWSDFTGWRAFTVSNIGIVAVDTAAVPTGKVDGNSAAIDWAARWWHTMDLAATHVQVRVLTSANAALTTGLPVAQAVASADQPPGTDFTVDSAVAGIGELPYGQALKWQIRAQASNGVWSGYSTAVPFRTNAIPLTPTLVSPALNAHSTSRPRLVVASTDADADDIPLTDVVWDFEVTEVATGTVRTALADAYDAVNGRPSYQTDATTVPTPGNYTWRARGRDLSAGEYGVGAWSAPFDFRLGVGPVVTIVNPAAGEWQLTTTVRVDWTTDDDQSAYQVTIYAVTATGARGALVYNSGKVAGSATFFDVPAGKLLNTTTYELVVSSWDLGNVQGTSAARQFFISYGAVEGVADVTADIIRAAGDVEPTTPAITWTTTHYPTSPSATGQFSAYIIRRWDGPMGVATSVVALAEIANPLQVSFRDYHAPPNRPQTYSVSQRIRMPNGTIRDSAETAVELTVTLTTPVVVSVANPSGLRFAVKWLGRNLQAGLKRRRSTYQTWGTGGVPTSSSAPGAQKLRQVGFTIMSDRPGETRWSPQSLAEYRRAIEAVVMAGGPVSWRDEFEVIFCDIADYSIQRGELGQMDVALQLEQVAFREGVA